jgi:predicted metal-dependent hydrolase
MLKTVDCTFNDIEFGEVVIRRNHRLKRLSLKVSDGRVFVCVPPNIAQSVALKFFEDNRIWVRATLEKSSKKVDSPAVWAPGYAFSTYSFSVQYSETTLQKMFGQFNEERSVLTIFYPNGYDFFSEAGQRMVKGIVANALLVEARRLLPDWLERLAVRLGLPFSGCKVLRMSSRWGSCSPSDEIHLSSSLLLLPKELIEFVMIHELCHTIEKNHGKRFHELLDFYTNGREKELAFMMKRYRTFKV